MATAVFNYGEEVDSNGTVTQQGTYGVQSSPKTSIPIIIENLRWLKDVAPQDILVNANVYTDTKVASLVNSAPATLDTLKELADALGDDAHFASTVTSLIGTKAPLASPTFTGTVGLPSTTSVGAVTATELGYLHGVTSGIQEQLNAKAPGSYGLGGASVGFTGDFNTLLTNGFFVTTSVSQLNCPNSDEMFFVLVSGSNMSNYVRQQAMGVATGITYMRNCTNGAWSAWKQLATTSISGAFGLTSDVKNNAPWYGLGFSNLADNRVQLGGYHGIDVITGGGSNVTFITHNFGIGKPSPQATLHSTGTTILGMPTNPSSLDAGLSNGEGSISCYNNSSIVFRVRGSDGVIRQGTIALV